MRIAMTYQSHHTNKKTGVTYVYEVVAFWDKEKKQARNKQVCIGKLDPGTGEVIPSKRLTSQKALPPAPTVTAEAKVIGPSVILDHLTERLGLGSLLRTCFPKIHRQILSMAYYLTIRGTPLSRADAWTQNHETPLESSLSSQRISEVLRDISTDGRETFFAAWMKTMMENDTICYDITSISSYAASNEYIKYGYNRDKESLPQLNLAMLFGQVTELPVYFQRMPGNISDVSTLSRLIKTTSSLQMPECNYVLDKGFYSKKNVDELLAARTKFTLSVPISNKWVQKICDEVREEIQGPEGYRKVDGEILYVHSRLYPWGDERRRCYVHLYYNGAMPICCV